MFEQLVASLAKRGVIVKLAGNYSVRHGRMSYSAEVKMDRHIERRTWPAFDFTVYGRDLGELADDINRRLPLVEPIIAALEKHREHRDAVRKADRIGEELSVIVNGGRSPDEPLEPNLDNATAMQFPIA